MEHEEKSLEKWVPSLDTREQLVDALEKAFDYRGDITLTLKSGVTMVGYIFNRRTDVSEPYLEIWPQDRDERLTVKYSDVAGLNFSGADMAAGKSWAAWVAKKKAVQ
jgi:hypothetical protein